MKTRKWSYGPITLYFTCEDFEDGKWLDTVVYLNGNEICTIAGSDVDSFIEDFKAFFIKYKI